MNYMKKNYKKILSIVFVLCLAFSGIHLYNNNISNHTVVSEYASNATNAQRPLNLESAYGDIQATHPKVLYFEEPWNGFNYWMSFTPYPGGDDSKENPHILASLNGIEWTEPNGFSNPLDDTPSLYAQSICYNSDSHLLYNEENDELECWWRYVNDHEDTVILYRRCSSDGVNWTPKEEMVKSKRSENDYVSFCLLFEDHIYKMWYIASYQIQYRESSDGREWSDRITKKVEMPQNELKIWHLDIIHTNQGYEAVFCAFDRNTDKYRERMSIYYSQSANNEQYSPAVEILKPSSSTNAWDNGGLYRPSILYKNGEYYLYYSGFSKQDNRGIGLSIAESINSFKVEQKE